MKPGTPPSHIALAEELRFRVLEGQAVTAPALRQAVSARAAGGAPTSAPFDDLARQIGEAAYRVTDEQVARVLQATGSERGAFEVIASAAVGAGLLRWQRGTAALKEATDAAG